MRHVPACSTEASPEGFDQVWYFHLPTNLLLGVGLFRILPREKLFALQHILKCLFTL